MESLGRLLTLRAGVDISVDIFAACWAARARAACLLPQEVFFSPWRCCKVDLRSEDDLRGIGDFETLVELLSIAVEAKPFSWLPSSWISMLEDAG